MKWVTCNNLRGYCTLQVIAVWSRFNDDNLITVLALTVKLYFMFAQHTVKDLPSLAVATCRNEWINELGKLDECYEVCLLVCVWLLVCTPVCLSQKFKDCYESSCKFDEEVESVLYLTEERFRSHSECLSHLNNFKQQL